MSDGYSEMNVLQFLEPGHPWTEIGLATAAHAAFLQPVEQVLLHPVAVVLDKMDEEVVHTHCPKITSHTFTRLCRRYTPSVAASLAVS